MIGPYESYYDKQFGMTNTEMCIGGCQPFYHYWHRTLEKLSVTCTSRFMINYKGLRKASSLLTPPSYICIFIPVMVSVALVLVASSPTPLEATQLTVVRFRLTAAWNTRRLSTSAGTPSTGVVVILGRVGRGRVMVHVTLGGGSPVARQVNSTSCRSTPTKSSGSRVMAGITV